MSGLETEETTRVGPPDWWDEMEFCHIANGEAATQWYCGERRDPAAPGDELHAVWKGEAICVYCEKPVCPRCAQFATLHNKLRDAS